MPFSPPTRSGCLPATCSTRRHSRRSPTPQAYRDELSLIEFAMRFKSSSTRGSRLRRPRQARADERNGQSSHCVGRQRSISLRQPTCREPDLNVAAGSGAGRQRGLMLSFWQENREEVFSCRVGRAGTSTRPVFNAIGQATSNPHQSNAVARKGIRQCHESSESTKCSSVAARRPTRQSRQMQPECDRMTGSMTGGGVPEKKDPLNGRPTADLSRFSRPVDQIGLSPAP